MDLLLFFFFLLTIPLFFFLFLTTSSSSSSSSSNSSIQTYPLIGNLPQFLRHRHRFLDWTTDILSSSPTNTFTVARLGSQGVITANPSNVEHLLKTNFSSFPKGPRSYTNLHDFLGLGIFNVDGHLWRSQRKTASFEFNTRSLRSFVVRIVQHEILNRLLPLLSDAAFNSTSLDLQDLLERFAFDNVCQLAFNEDPACLTADHVTEFPRAFRVATELISGRFRYALPRFWMLKKMFNIGSEKRLKESIATVHEFAERIIRMRRKEKKSDQEDLLSRFMADKENSDVFLRDIVISFILAGRDTTSSALTWFFWLLASHPEVDHRIVQEVRAVRAKRELDSAGTEAFDYDELREMQYIHAAISESMRLYPPVPVDTMMCNEDQVFPDGTAAKRGWFVTYHAYAMGRMVGIWGEDCRKFKPERWLDEDGNFQPESPYKYPVFHAGPRMCLGKEMAYIQMKSIIACVLERFVVEVIDKERIPGKTQALTLRMKGGLHVRIRERLPTVVA
ncbi:putative cytochrome P450 [Dioscorea sansibarensis]